MNRSDDPFAFFPFAVAGVVFGLVMLGGCGYFAFDHGPAGRNARGTSSHAIIEGRVAWAGWRTSAAREGPNRFLQLRFENDPRGFLVAAEDLPRARRRQFDRSRTGESEIPDLMGTPAAVAVDSALLNEETPYMSGLRIGKETIIPVDGEGTDSPAGWRQPALLLLYWMGMLVGLGILGVSVQHVVVCIRYRRRGAG